MGGENATRSGDIHSHIPDNRHGTPLLHASDNGHERAAMILLRLEEVNLGKPNNDDRAPPLYATDESSVEEVKLAIDPATGITDYARCSIRRSWNIFGRVVPGVSPNGDWGEGLNTINLRGPEQSSNDWERGGGASRSILCFTLWSFLTIYEITHV